jgi:hypothetical protein
MTDNAAGWQPDPTGKHDHRYWDGTQWTDNVADAGVAATDPYVAPDPALAPPEAPAADAPPTDAEPPPAAEPVAETPGDEPTVVTPIEPEDPTDSYPTAATQPAPPPPYVPPTPVPDGGSDRGGNKRGLVIGGAILAAVAVAVIAFLLLGSDDDSDVRAQMASAIENDTDLSASQAECVADLIVDEAGEDTFADTDFTAEDPPDEFVEAFVKIGIDEVLEACDLDEAAFGSDGSTDSSDGGGEGPETLEDLRDECADGDLAACDDLYFSADLGSDLEEFGSTCGGTMDPQEGFCELGGDEGFGTDGSSDDFTDGLSEDALAQIYAEAFGISDEQAECLAGKLSDAIDDGDFSEEEAMSEIFDYLEDCDISLEEIGAN